MEEMLFKTDTDYAPWTIIESIEPQVRHGKDL